MNVTKYFPPPSDRMGFLWTLTSVEDCFVVEFGPAGTTHFALEGAMELNAEHRMNVFTTHMSEMDITFGRHDKLAGAIREVDAQHHPRYIFVMASSVSALIGIDIESICFEMADEVGARLIPVPYGGYDGGCALGVERALLLLTKELVTEQEQCDGLYNIVGCTIDSLNFISDRCEAEHLLFETFGLRCNSCFTAYTSIEELERAGRAKLNVVLRAQGLKAAEYMRQKFGIAYVYKKPYGAGSTLAWLTEIASLLGLPPNMDWVRKKTQEVKRHIQHYKGYLRTAGCRRAVIYADYDTAAGMAELLSELGLEPEAIFVCHAPFGEQDKDTRVRFQPGEDELKAALGQEYYAAFGDDTLRKLCGGKRFLQIANPNMDEYLFYPLTPFIGFNGALYLLQYLMNMERAARR